MDVYLALLDAKKHGEANRVQLSPEESRLLDKMILDRTRNGLGLEEDQRQKLIEVRRVGACKLRADEGAQVKKKIMELSVDFQRHCNEEKGFLLFTAEVRTPLAVLSSISLTARRAAT